MNPNNFLRKKYFYLILSSIIIISLGFVIAQVVEEISDQKRVEKYGELNISGTILRHVFQGRDTNVSLAVSDGSSFVDVSSLVKPQFEFKADKYKFAFNISIPNTGQGNVLAGRIKEVIFNISSGYDLIPHPSGFSHLTTTDNEGLVSGQEYLHWDFSDIQQSFQIQRTEFDEDLNQNVTFNETIPLLVEKAGDNILLRFNFTEIRFARGQVVFLDPIISLTNVTYYPSAKHNITCENSALCHITVNDSSLISYYPMDINKSTLIDWAGPYDGTITNAFWNSTGWVGGAMQFDGSADSVNLGTMNENEGKNEIAISVWVKSKTAASPGFNSIITTKAGSANDRHSRIRWAAGTEDVECSIWNSGNTEHLALFAAGIADTNWHHIVCQANATHVSVYVDGVLGGTIVAWTGPTDTVTTNQFIGSASTNAVWNGTIDEVMFFNRSLNFGEVMDLYNNQSLRFKQPAVQSFFSASLGQNGSRNRLNVTTNTTQYLDSSMQARIYEWNGTAYNDSIDGTGKNDGLIFALHLDNKSQYGENDTKVVDFAGTANGTVEGAVVNTSEGYYNQSFTFDGTNDRINFSDVNALDGLGNITVSAWFYPESLSAGGEDIVSKGFGNIGAFRGTFAIQVTTTEYVFFIANSTLRAQHPFSGKDSATDTWAHLALTYNGTTFSSYVDGVLNNRTAFFGLLNNSAFDLLIGTGTAYIDGRVDEVLIWNRSLSDIEIAELASKGRLRFDTVREYQSILAGNMNVTPFNMSKNTRNVALELNYSAGNTSFYSPMLHGSIMLESWDAAEEAPPAGNSFLVNVTANIQTYADRGDTLGANRNNDASLQSNSFMGRTAFMFKSISQYFSLNAVMDFIAGLFRSSSANVNIDDSVSKNQGVLKSLSENIKIGINAIRVFFGGKSVQDSLSIDEGVDRDVSAKRSSTASINLDDSTSVNKGFMRRMSENIKINMNAVRNYFGKRFIADYILINERLNAPTGVQPQNNLRSVAASFSLFGLTDSLLNLFRAEQENIDLSEGIDTVGNIKRDSKGYLSFGVGMSKIRSSLVLSSASLTIKESMKKTTAYLRYLADLIRFYARGFNPNEAPPVPQAGSSGIFLLPSSSEVPYVHLNNSLTFE